MVWVERQCLRSRWCWITRMGRGRCRMAGHLLHSATRCMTRRSRKLLTTTCPLVSWCHLSSCGTASTSLWMHESFVCPSRNLLVSACWLPWRRSTVRRHTTDPEIIKDGRKTAYLNISRRSSSTSKTKSGSWRRLSVPRLPSWKSLPSGPRRGSTKVRLA